MQESQSSDYIYNDFVRFMAQPFPTGTYNDKLQNQDLKSLVISLEHLRHYNFELVDGLLNEPIKYYPSLVRAVDDAAMGYGLQKKQVGLMGIMADHHVTPRGLRSHLINKLVCVECIVTKSALTKPKLKKSVQYNTSYVKTERYYNDGYGIDDEIATSTALPTHDAFEDPLELQPGLCEYENHQYLIAQEIPESTPAGQLPRAIDILLSGSLCDSVKPGDRVQIVGLFRTMGGGKFANYKRAIIAIHITPLNQSATSIKISPHEISQFKLIAKKKSIISILSESIAPSIYGHSTVKKGLLLSLLGGVEKELNQGGRLRGSINVLLMGDPSVGKSQLLRFVNKVAPLSIQTTGRGASGVGLTAAVATDQESGEKTLEAGACVLADNGHVLLDEFDKMNDIDRVAIHEVMEQQSISISKAGLCVTLNARCSIIAAANPIYGLYDESLNPHKNIHLPDSLLSRFDLLFIMLDRPNTTIDMQLSQHVLTSRCYIPSHYQLGQVMEDLPQLGLMKDTEQEDEEEQDILVNNIVPQAQLKKYLWYAKHIKPVLTQKASNYLTKKYGELRNSTFDQHKTLPVTVRSLETMIRLSTAFAKARLSSQITIKDAEQGYDMLKISLFKKVIKLNKKAKIDTESSSEEEIEAEESTVVSYNRLDAFMQVASQLFESTDQYMEDELYGLVIKTMEMDRMEYDHYLTVLMDENKVFRSEGLVIKV